MLVGGCSRFETRSAIMNLARVGISIVLVFLIGLGAVLHFGAFDWYLPCAMNLRHVPAP